jgi:predicted dehydrogenase
VSPLPDHDRRLRIGIVGCGDVTHRWYLPALARLADRVEIAACCDPRREAAEAVAAAVDGWSPRAVSYTDLDAFLAESNLDAVFNLSPAPLHASITQPCLDAGLHVYSEKPLAARFSEGQALMLAAAGRGVRVGCAPDTFLGAAHQACRRAIDAGLIGRPVAGAAAVLSHGMEHWHPNPEFFFKRGGGPIHDVGPYYVTQLVNLLGPVARVAAQASMGNPTRTVTSERRRGQVVDVEVPTTVNGVLSFVSGANVSLSASWDVWKHRRLPFEIYGAEGSMLVPDPNFFGGGPQITARDSDWQPLDISAHPYGIANRTLRSGAQVADYRTIGLLDMAAALHKGRAHRANGDLALHVLEVLDAFERSSVEGHHMMIETPCERPEPLPLGAGDEVFLQ